MMLRLEAYSCFTGDFFQYPPVVCQGNEYESIDVFAFASSAWKAAKTSCMLSDRTVPLRSIDTLTNILNAIRLGEVRRRSPSVTSKKRE